jgi:hypothetical protein
MDEFIDLAENSGNEFLEFEQLLSNQAAGIDTAAADEVSDGDDHLEKDQSAPAGECTLNGIGYFVNQAEDSERAKSKPSVE